MVQPFEGVKLKIEEERELKRELIISEESSLLLKIIKMFNLFFDKSTSTIKEIEESKDKDREESLKAATQIVAETSGIF